MNPCDQHRANVLLYLDEQLSGEALESFCTHLASCPDCKGHMEEEQALSRLLDRSHPLYPAPERLRARVAAAAAQHASASCYLPDGLRERYWQIVIGPLRYIATQGFNWKTAVAMILVLGAGLVLAPDIVRQTNASAYVETAVATHRGYLNGQFPLGIRSDSPEEVTAWFADKLPFHFRLPNSQLVPGGSRPYRMMGARRLNYKGRSIALIVYETRSEKVSLLVAPSESAVAEGGDQVRFSGLTFHYRSKANFKVITWSNHDLTYALVSSLQGSARQSCLVCHQNMTDHGAFAPSR